MEETLKKLVYAGVGMAAQATERFEQAVNDLVEKGKISDKEGKKIVDDFFAKSEKRKEEFESKFKKTTEDVVGRFNFAKAKDLEKLTKKVAQLEKELKKVTGNGAVKKPAAKTVASKS